MRIARDARLILNELTADRGDLYSWCIFRGEGLRKNGLESGKWTHASVAYQHEILREIKHVPNWFVIVGPGCSRNNSEH